MVLAYRFWFQCKGNWNVFVDKMIDSNRDTDLRDAGEKRVNSGADFTVFGNDTMRPVDGRAIENRREGNQV